MKMGKLLLVLLLAISSNAFAGGLQKTRLLCKPIEKLTDRQVYLTIDAKWESASLHEMAGTLAALLAELRCQSIVYTNPERIGALYYPILGCNGTNEEGATFSALLNADVTDGKIIATVTALQALKLPETYQLKCEAQE